MGAVTTPILQVRKQRRRAWPVHTAGGRQGLGGNLQVWAELTDPDPAAFSWGRERKMEAPPSQVTGVRSTCWKLQADVTLGTEASALSVITAGRGWLGVEPGMGRITA